MNKLEAVGRLIQWAIEFNEFDVRYQPRSAIKTQVLADFGGFHCKVHSQSRWAR